MNDSTVQTAQAIPLSQIAGNAPNKKFFDHKCVESLCHKNLEPLRLLLCKSRAVLNDMFFCNDVSSKLNPLSS